MTFDIYFLSLAELQSTCLARNIEISPIAKGKAPFVTALRQHVWEQDHPGVPVEKPISPMLLNDWTDLSPSEVVEIERDGSGWGVQEKRDGVRALLHITPNGVRITGRSESRVTFRPCEYQENLPHLTVGLNHLMDTILDGELVCLNATVNTGTTVSTSALQAAVAALLKVSDNRSLLPLRFGAHRFSSFVVDCRRLINSVTLVV